MKYICLIAVVLFCLTSSAASVELKDVTTYSLPQDQAERVVLEMRIGQAELLSPSIVDRLYDKEIYAVAYVYTKFADPSFNQGQLNKDRMARIMEVLPQVKMPDVRWSVIRQTECVNVKCASQALHGFVISYRAKELLSEGILQKQFFSVDSESASTQIGKNGTVLRIPQDAFVDGYDRSITGEVNFILREAISPKDYVKAGLATKTTGGEILQTGGMIEIQAYQDGRNLDLASGKSIVIEIPTADPMDGMQFYKGALDKGEIVWEEPTEIEVVEQSRPDDNQEDSMTSTGLEVVGFSYEYYGRMNRFNRLISSINWERNSDTLTAIRAKIDGQNVSLNRDELYLQRGLEIGLDTTQALIAQSWFEMDTVIILQSEVDTFLGFPERRSNDFSKNRNLFGPARNSGMSVSNMPNFEMYYQMSARGLGWCNVDRLARLPNSIPMKLEVELSGELDEENVQIVLHLSKQNLVLAGRKSKNGKYNFNQSNFKNWIQLPEGEEAQIIAMSNKGERCSLGIENLTLESGKSISIPMTTMSKVKALKSIDSIL